MGILLKCKIKSSVKDGPRTITASPNILALEGGEAIISIGDSKYGDKELIGLKVIVERKEL